MKQMLDLLWARLEEEKAGKEKPSVSCADLTCVKERSQGACPLSASHTELESSHPRAELETERAGRIGGDCSGGNGQAKRVARQQPEQGTRLEGRPCAALQSSPVLS